MKPRFFLGLTPHGFHRVAYYEWGDAANPRVVVCVHGLTRNGRDFDDLARRLMSTHRVIAVDMPGRGESEWLREPMEYGFPTYLTTLTALLARTGADRVDWMGTSMGGLLGMVMAAQPNSPVARLVLNDVGPVLEAAALARMSQYVGADPTFETYAEILEHVRSVSAPFGDLTDAQWEHLTRSSVAERADGRWGFRYDPRLALPFRASPAPAHLWSVWDAITCPTLLLRGSESDLLSEATAQAMTTRGPKAELVQFAKVGHAPALMSVDQIDPVAAFLGR
ncbi:MAG: alpha/beta hydrolase [Pseudomonadota bacterium]|nr:alpha/beta hydrolase [Pseudomonadota bacterium]